VLWILAILLNIFCAWFLRRKYGSSQTWPYVIPFLVAILIANYLFVVVAPYRWQGCQTDVPYSAWDAYCTAPDSASYYFGYQVGSPRNPLYPWFIKLSTLGIGFDPAVYYQHYPVSVAISARDAPLFRVVHAQIIVLLAAGFAACTIMMALLNSPLPAVLFLFLFDFGCLAPHELNEVLTEPLVQTWLFPLVAVFLMFLWKGWKNLLPVAGLFCGLLYLTRQAAAYTMILLVAMIVWGMLTNWRVYILPAVTSIVVLVCLVVIPDLYGYVKTGDFLAAQNSLQYQYRVAFAMQVAQPEDVSLMRDEESRQWLLAALERRDIEHRKVDEMCQQDLYCRMVYYIDTNLYQVAMPPGFIRADLPGFLMSISTRILTRHWTDYVAFGARFWMLGITDPRVGRIRVGGIGPWLIYALCFVVVFVRRGPAGFAAAMLILAHFTHLALISTHSVPMIRTVRASDFLVVIAIFLLLWDIAERISQGVGDARRRSITSSQTT